MNTRPRLAVDIGGTFTDIALETATGWFTTKVLTTPRAPEQAVIEGTRLLLAESGIAQLTALQKVAVCG